MFSHPQTQELEASEARLLDAARLIELHSEAVDKALLVLRSAVATGADWTTLQEYIKVGGREGLWVLSSFAVVALRIHSSVLHPRSPYSLYINAD